LLIVVALSALLMVGDLQKSAITQGLRFALGYVAAPIYYVANMPANLSQWFGSTLVSREDLSAENERLSNENLLLQRRVQKLVALSAENVRLRGLLNSSTLVDDSVLVAEIIGVDTDPYRHEVIINQGATKGIQVGFPVLDSAGLIGQIIDVGPVTSRILLISDPMHATPVQVNRNGIRAIVVGGPSLSKLHVIHIPDTADLREGDILVSSGLGGRFPFGYPVAKITRIEHDPGEPFARVDATPLSRLDRTRHTLVVMDPAAEFEFDDQLWPQNNGEFESADVGIDAGIEAGVSAAVDE